MKQDWPLKCYIHSECSYKVLFPLGPNLWPQFRLREICGEQGLLACGFIRNTQSPDMRLYLFLFHLSIGACPLHPRISAACFHYSTVCTFFREGKGSSYGAFFVLFGKKKTPKKTLQILNSPFVTFDVRNVFQ